MKKNLLFAIATVAVVFAGCNPPSPENTNSIKVKHAAREIAIGDEIKVDVIVNPADAKLTYTSSNPEVASVTSFGIINGLEEGNTTIVVEAEGIGKDSMIVYVSEASALFTLGGFTLWDLDVTTTTSDIRDSVLLSDGTKPVCKLCPGEWHIWDNNLSFDKATGRISGAGYVIILENVPTYIIDDDNYEGGQYNGYYIGTSTLEISEKATGDSAYMIKPGRIIDATKWADLLDGVDSTLTLADCIYDQAMHYIDYTNQKSYSYQAFVGEGIIKGNSEAVQYKQTIDWLGGIYGLAYDEEIDPETGEVTDYIIRRPVETLIQSIYYENWEDEEQAEVRVIKRYVAPLKDIQVNRNVKTTDRLFIAK